MLCRRDLDVALIYIYIYMNGELRDTEVELNGITTHARLLSVDAELACRT